MSGTPARRWRSKYKPAGINVGMLATFPFARWYEGTAPSDGFRFELRLTKVFDLL